MCTDWSDQAVVDMRRHVVLMGNVVLVQGNHRPIIFVQINTKCKLLLLSNINNKQLYQGLRGLPQLSCSWHRLKPVLDLVYCSKTQVNNVIMVDFQILSSLRLSFSQQPSLSLTVGLRLVNVLSVSVSVHSKGFLEEKNNHSLTEFYGLKRKLCFCS